MLHAATEKRRRDRLRDERPPLVIVEPVPVAPKRPKNVVIAEFNYMLDQAKLNDWAPKCEDKPDLYADYRYSPTAAEAEALCDGCPMKALCLERATVTYQGWGVWGGVAFSLGKPFISTRAQIANETD